MSNNNNNNNECNRECKNTSSSWTRRSSDRCAVQERYAQSEGSSLYQGDVREALEHVLDIQKFRHNALQGCDNPEKCDLTNKHNEAMGARIGIENDLKRLNNISSTCINSKYNPLKEDPSDNIHLLTNENSWNCRIPPKLDIYNPHKIN